MYSWGVRKSRGHPRYFLTSFQRMAPSTPSLKPPLTSAFLAARKFDLQKSEDMLRKVRPHSREPPASSCCTQGLATSGGDSWPVFVVLLRSSSDPFLHQTRVPHSSPPGIPVPGSVSAEPGHALGIFGVGSLQVLPCLHSTWSSGSNRPWTTSSRGSPQR